MSIINDVVSRHDQAADPALGRARPYAQKGSISFIQLRGLLRELSQEIERLEQIREENLGNIDSYKEKPQRTSNYLDHYHLDVAFRPVPMTPSLENSLVIDPKLTTLRILSRRLKFFWDSATKLKLKHFPFDTEFMNFAEKAFEITPKRGEHYELVGKGAYGGVFKATYNHHDVAVKIENSASKKFELYREANTLLHLNHQNVVHLVDIDLRNSGLILELADTDLQKHLLSGDPIDSRQVTVEILRGLDFVHSKDFVHGDIKPNNILVKGGHVLIADFGLSTKSGQEANGLCNLRYRPPEFFGYKVYPRVYPQTDLWSAGVVFYQILSKTPEVDPFTKEELNLKEHAEALPHLEERLKAHEPSYDQRVFQVAMHCLKISPKERESAHNLLNILEES